IQINARNLRITHTHLIFLAQKLSYNIAKRTIEDDLNYFEKKGQLESEKLGDSKNSLRVWSMYRPEHDFEIIAKKESKNIVTSLEQYVNTIEKNFKKINKVNKDYAMANLLDIIHSWQPIIEIINQDTKIRNEKKKFDSLVNRAYQILQHENRDYIDGRPFLRRLLHLKASEPMMNMNNFLEEIK
ncbi:MAG: hypothetical protein IIC67_08510, partial [Thaumarchaeota archaeon]|nr:hypothetical protein [Nitrososphaerota archaeon]